MEERAQTAEQRQFLVEIEAVVAGIDKQGDAQKMSYEVAQGRKLIEKAVSLCLPEASYAELRAWIAGHDGEVGA